MENINLLQFILKENNVKAYIIPTSDFHNSEYISDYFKVRQFMSGFTGSAGTLVITLDKALLWVDGRYHIQAQKEVDEKTITVMKQGLPNVPTIGEYLNGVLCDDDVLAFDGRVTSASFVEEIMSSINKKVNIKSDVDLTDLVWLKRPELPFSVLYKLDTFFSGIEYKDKLKLVKEKMYEFKANAFILSKLEDQAWLYNLRANDIPHTPVFLSFTVITENETILFIEPNKIDTIIEKYLYDNNITVKPYFDFFEYIKIIKDKNILVDYNNISYQIINIIKNNNHVINKPNPTLLLKSIKNDREILNTKIAHIKDGVAFTRFFRYVKNQGLSLPNTEFSLGSLIDDLRKDQEGFVDISFDTICAYKDHGAMMHYKASEESSYQIEDSGFLLVDSGGHYLEGTTDITRTIAIGQITDQMKLHYTTVLKSVIALSNAVFLKGCNGMNLDILARGPIWQLNIDYKCGTGHGVGYLLSVHEAPNGFRWQKVAERNDSAILQEGMITTNEPGIYLEHKYGIRLENELLCVPKGKNEFGEFLGFETITYAPFDLDAINEELLNPDERKWLNTYHQMVYDKLSSSLSLDERKWLRFVTRKI